LTHLSQKAASHTHPKIQKALKPTDGSFRLLEATAAFDCKKFDLSESLAQPLVSLQGVLSSTWSVTDRVNATAAHVLLLLVQATLGKDSAAKAEIATNARATLVYLLASDISTDSSALTTNVLHQLQSLHLLQVDAASEARFVFPANPLTLDHRIHSLGQWLQLLRIVDMHADSVCFVTHLAVFVSDFVFFRPQIDLQSIVPRLFVW
jgi:hypothetical protein